MLNEKRLYAWLWIVLSVPRKRAPASIKPIWSTRKYKESRQRQRGRSSLQKQLMPFHRKWHQNFSVSFLLNFIEALKYFNPSFEDIWHVPNLNSLHRKKIQEPKQWWLKKNPETPRMNCLNISTAKITTFNGFSAFNSRFSCGVLS